MSKKSTKKALILSVISLLACVSMLVGSTFAWFTDSVTSAGNKIQAGTLKIDLEMLKNGNWVSIKDNPQPIFDYDLWEPGYTDVKVLKIENEGTLALKWIAKFQSAVELSKLADVIDVYVLASETEIGYPADRNLSGYEKVGTVAEFVNSISETTNGYLLAKKSAYLGIALKMQESAGNEYQDLSLGEFDIQIFATQYTYEEDSFDKYYDKDAAVYTVAEANALLAAGKDAVLAYCNDPDGVLEVPADYTGTLTLVGATIDSVVAAEDVNVVIVGDVVVKAQNGSAISANGALSISGSGNLTAIAANNHAYGIGGANATSVSVKDITIDYVAGGHVGGVGSDLKYYKDAPEGGAAIGSGKDGASITLDNVTIVKAMGGSKAAAIGANYHVGVTVTIKDSTIAYAEGGVSAAAIGGSRVSNGAAESGTTIIIENSTVKAQGGAFGAGIGSGYDTHCQAVQPLCTINIADSVIDATGGKYAAGVGTGYHNAALAGEIKNSTIHAVSGEKVYKNTYTSAMDIGFGVTDPTREGQQTGSQLTINGTVITLADAPFAVTSATELKNALNAGGDVVLGADIALEAINIANPNFVLDGNGYTITQSGTNTYALIDTTGGSVTLKNVTFDGINGGGVVRTVGAKFNASNVTVQNSNHTQQQGLFRLMGESTIENCVFKNNVCSMAITLNYDGANNDPQIVKNCVFENNTCNSTAVVYYVKGAGCTLDGNKFIGNTVNCSTNGATVYMGFTENNVVTNNLFMNNNVTDSQSSTRVSGGIFFGYECVFEGNAFINNTAANAAGTAKGNNVCISTYYTDIDLSGNYWGGNAPVENEDYFVQHKDYGYIVINGDYLTENPLA